MANDIVQRAIDFVLREAPVLEEPCMLMWCVCFKMASCIADVAEGGWELYSVFLLQDCLEQSLRGGEVLASFDDTVAVARAEVEQCSGMLNGSSEGGE